MSTGCAPSGAGGPPDVALAGLASMTPQRLQRLLRGRQAAEVYADLCTPRTRLVSRLMHAESTTGPGRVRAAQIVQAWRRSALESEPSAIWERLRVAGTAVYRRGDPGISAAPCR